jgi:hypothetical protein
LRPALSESAGCHHGSPDLVIRTPQGGSSC